MQSQRIKMTAHAAVHRLFSELSIATIVHTFACQTQRHLWYPYISLDSLLFRILLKLLSLYLSFLCYNTNTVYFARTSLWFLNIYRHNLLIVFIIFVYHIWKTPWRMRFVVSCSAQIVLESFFHEDVNGDLRNMVQQSQPKLTEMAWLCVRSG